VIIIKEIVQAIQGFQTVGKLQAYLFGSALNTSIAWSDIDILIVCDLENDGFRARQILSELCMAYPIDLVIMTVEEESEFDFIRSEACRWLAESQVKAG
jgi:predicted nucleotidyltransferase